MFILGNTPKETKVAASIPIRPLTLYETLFKDCLKYA